MIIATYNIPFIHQYDIREETHGQYTIWADGCKTGWGPFSSFIQAYNHLHREVLVCVSIELGLVRDKEQQLQALQRKMIGESLDAYKVTSK